MALLDRLRRPEPLIGIELRPPRADAADGGADAWLGMASAVRRLAARDTAVFLTDSAVGTAEEENLRHLVANLDPDVPRDRICPFLTTKHTLEYCLWYADRAVASGYGALTVLGGDTTVGAPRCLPHAQDLRARIRARHPGLALGGWANPHKDPAGQVGLIRSPAFCADFFLTQIVSHHDLDAVQRFLAALGPGATALFGVFHWRSANPKTLKALARFLPVPAEGLTREFGAGVPPDEIAARSIRALRGLGVRHVYLSNLSPDDAPERLEAIGRLVG